MKEFEYDDSEIDELQETLNVEVNEAEIIEEKQNNDSFDDKGNVVEEEIEDEDEKKEDLEKILLGGENETNENKVLESKDVAKFLDLANNMIANTISQFTGKETKRYSLDKTSSKTVADAYVKAFPTMTMSPKSTLFFVLFMAYLPIITNTYKDVKELKNEQKASTNTDNFRNERDGENNTITLNSEQHNTE